MTTSGDDFPAYDDEGEGPSHHRGESDLELGHPNHKHKYKSHRSNPKTSLTNAEERELVEDTTRRAHAEEVGEIARLLGTHPFSGLSSKQVARRRALFGRNIVASSDDELPAWLRPLARFLSTRAVSHLSTLCQLLKKIGSALAEPLILLLLGSATISLILGEFEDAIGIVLAVVIVTAVGMWQEHKSERSVEALRSLTAHQSVVVRDGVVREMPAEDVVVGDLVLVQLGARIPADLRLLDCQGTLQLDESAFTGETHHASKRPDSIVSLTEPLAHRANMAYMGSMVVCGAGRGICVAVGSQTELGKIAAEIEELDPPRSPLQVSLDDLGKKLSFGAFALVGLIFLAGFFQGKPALQMFTIAVSLAVAAIPEGLPIVVTLTLALGVNRIANRHAIVRRLPIVESLGATSIICSDKTGTLTKNQMTVRALFTDHYTFVSGVGYCLQGSFHRSRVAIHDSDEDEVPAGSRISFGPDSRALSSIIDSTIKTEPLLDPATDPHLLELLHIGVLCNSAFFGEDNNNNHILGGAAASSTSFSNVPASSATSDRLIGAPTEGAVLNVARKARVADLRTLYQKTDEIPFDSETKWMAVRYNLGDCDRYYVKGASHVVIPRCTTYYRQSAKSGTDGLDQSSSSSPSPSPSSSPSPSPPPFGSAGGLGGLELLPMTEAKVNELQTEVQRLGNNGYRVLAFASGTDLTALTFVGLMGISDPIRPGVREAIAKCMDASVEVVMLTGDSAETARTVATELGFFDIRSHMLSGPEVERMSVDELAEADLEHVRVFYRVSPSHKTKIVAALQKKKHIVGMTGDGINDAPALKKAHIGIVMGSGIDVAKEASDMILVDDNFSTIEAAIEEGRSIYSNIKNFVRFQLTTSIATLSLIALATLSDLPLPMNTIQILFINIIMDGPPAQTLGMEPYDPDVMKAPPRRPGQSIFNADLIRSIGSASITMFAGTLAVFWTYLPDDFGSNHNYDGENLIEHDPLAVQKAMTIAFTTFVCFQLFNALNCRNIARSIFQLSPFTNKPLAGSLAVCLGLLLLTIYNPFFQFLFTTTPLTLTELLSSALVASSVLIVDEIRKAFFVVAQQFPDKRRHNEHFF